MPFLFQSYFLHSTDSLLFKHPDSEGNNYISLKRCTSKLILRVRVLKFHTFVRILSLKIFFFWLGLLVRKFEKEILFPDRLVTAISLK